MSPRPPHNKSDAQPTAPRGPLWVMTIP